jgi:hypothetical protein
MNKENTVLGFSLAPFEHRNTEDLSLSLWIVMEFVKTRAKNKYPIVAADGN